MLTRCLSLFAASLAVVAVGAGPAQSQTDIPAPSTPAGACTDQSPPTSGYSSKAAKKAKRSHVLRGTARDVGCGLDRVQISVGLRKGKRCQYLTTASKLSRKKTSCGHVSTWLSVKGTTRWSFRLPKKLKKGTYVIRTRATDFAGNVQRLKSRRLGIR